MKPALWVTPGYPPELLLLQVQDGLHLVELFAVAFDDVRRAQLDVLPLDVFPEVDCGQFLFELGERLADFLDALGVGLAQLGVQLAQVVQPGLRATYRLFRWSRWSVCFVIRLKDLSWISFLFSHCYLLSLNVSFFFRCLSRKFLKLCSSWLDLDFNCRSASSTFWLLLSTRGYSSLSLPMTAGSSRGFGVGRIPVGMALVLILSKCEYESAPQTN